MVFSSLLFLFYFLPLTLVAYFLSPLKWRNLVLLAVSLLFYGWGEPIYITIMLLSIAIDYSHGLLVEKHRDDDKKARRIVAQSIVFNLLLLGFFKYYDFFALNLNGLFGISLPILNIPLPIGISFFTFQTMSYTVDVYRKDAPAQRNLVNFGAFVTMFPQLIAGPIVKYKTVANELNHRDHTAQDFAQGASRFVVGLSKKVLLANNIGALWDSTLLASQAGDLTVIGGWLGLMAFAFQIYFDFSGYSDMAIGLGQMMGFRFDENFNHPYTAISVSDFWRRWHMSLTSWFREYVYIPLGGNRGGLGKSLRNLFIVWLCTGFWHGASWNFLLWGLYFALWLSAEKYWLSSLLNRAPTPLRHVYTLFVVLIGWGLFAIEDMTQVATYLATCFGSGTFASPANWYDLQSYGLTLLVLIVAATPVGKTMYARLPAKVYTFTTPVLMVLGLVVSTAFLVSSSYNPFLYFRF
ncbi:MBOAT family O-acyltransferase [Bengtsoniella intestinalis]|uniref:MBOAT family O-acyltransferase n=1 Tax=Bengtsoniella intestinalis TaxID=3073143 RepID=UPI00391FA555